MQLMKFMKNFVAIALSVSALSQSLFAQTALPLSPFLSSIPALFLQPNDFEPDEAEITLHPERTDLPVYSDRNRLHYTYALQEDKTAPLLFVVPGTGGTANQSNTLFLAEIAYRQGYSVVTIPSTSHWSFALAASSDGRTGYLPKDGADNYKLLLTLRYRLEREEGIRPRKFGLIGFSYGGLDGEQLIQQDQRQHQFGFSFLIMINTPLNLMAAIQKVDNYYNQGSSWPEKTRMGLKSFAVGRSIDIANGRIKINTPEDLKRAFPLREERLAWILASSFRDSIRESALAAELVAGRNVSAQEALPETLDIGTYLKEKVFTPISKKQKRPIESLIADNNLMIANAHLANGTPTTVKTIVFHSEDDFLSFPEFSDRLGGLPAELHVAPSGGHLGNLTNPSVIKELKEVLLRVKN